VTFTVALVPALPAASKARVWSAWPPFDTVVVFHANEYGAVVSVPATAPSTSSSTRLTPTSSLALADTVVVPLTVAPFPGEVIEVLGGVVSPLAPKRE
jgi:hypothetical protein